MYEILCTHVHMMYQALNQEFLRAGQASENKGTSTNI